MDKIQPIPNLTKNTASGQLFKSNSTNLTFIQDSLSSETTKSSKCAILNFNDLIYPDFHSVENFNSKFTHFSWHPEITNIVSSDAISSEYLSYPGNSLNKTCNEFKDQQSYENDNYTIVEDTEFGVKSYCVLQNSGISLSKSNQSTSTEYSNYLNDMSNYEDALYSKKIEHQRRECDYKYMDNFDCTNQCSLLENSAKDIPSAECLTLYNCSFEDFVSNDEINPYLCSDQTNLNYDFKQNGLLNDNSKMSETIAYKTNPITPMRESFPKLNDYTESYEPYKNLSVSDCLSFEFESNLSESLKEEKVYTNVSVPENVGDQENLIMHKESDENDIKDNGNKKIAISSCIKYSHTERFFDLKQTNRRVTLLMIQPKKSNFQNYVNKSVISPKIKTSKSRKTPNKLGSDNETVIEKSSIICNPVECIKNKSYTKRPKLMYPSDRKLRSSCIEKSEPGVTERRLSEESDTLETATEKSKEPSKCKICNELMYMQTPLKKNFRVSVERVVDVCSACNICFLQKSRLEAMQDSKKPYQCSYCYKRFSKKFDFQSHVKDHVTVKPFKCMDCDRTFSRRAQLTVHSRIHKIVPPLSCGVCNKNFIKKSHLNQHFKVHTGELRKTRPSDGKLIETSCSEEFVHDYRLNCLVCDKSFSSKIYLDQHLKEHAPEKLHYCITCDRGFVHRSNLRYHSKGCRARMKQALFDDDSKSNSNVPYELIYLDGDL